MDTPVPSFGSFNDTSGQTVLHGGPLADCVVPEERGESGTPLPNRDFPDGDLVHQYQCRAGGAYYVFVQSLDREPATERTPT